MIIIVVLFSLTQVSSNVLFEILLKGGTEEIYKVSNPRKSILELANKLDKIQLSNHQKTILWDVFKENRNPEEISAEDLGKIAELLSSIPEDDLSKFNISDWRIVEILGRTKTFTRPQTTTILTTLKMKYGVNKLIQSCYINKLGNLICGFSEDELAQIPKRDFKNINSSVFAKISACSETQLKILLQKVVDIYGMPKSWSRDVIRHIGYIILALHKSEIRALRPSALEGLNIDIILTSGPQFLQYLSEAQLDNLNSASKMNIGNFFRSSASTLKEITFLTGLLLRAYLLLKF